MPNSLVPYRPDDQVPNDLLRSMVQAANVGPAPNSPFAVNTMEEAKGALNVWHTLTYSVMLPGKFAQAETWLAEHDSPACNQLANAFDKQARNSLKQAGNAFKTVLEELDKKTPSVQMVTSALNYALGEVTENCERIRNRLHDACREAYDEPAAPAAGMKTVMEPPVEALRELQALQYAMKTGIPCISKVIKEKIQRTTSK